MQHIKHTLALEDESHASRRCFAMGGKPLHCGSVEHSAERGVIEATSGQNDSNRQIAVRAAYASRNGRTREDAEVPKQSDCGDNRERH